MDPYESIWFNLHTIRVKLMLRILLCMNRLGNSRPIGAKHVAAAMRFELEIGTRLHHAQRSMNQASVSRVG